MHSSFFGAFRLVAERFIRHIVGCCLLFVLIINFSPCQKANCVLFVSGALLGNLPPLDKHVFKGINCATHTLSIR